MSRRAFTMLEVRRALDMECRGYSQREIARALGRRCHRQLGKHLRRHRARPRPPRDGLPENAARLRRLHARGASIAFMARELRVSQTTVRRWLVRLGLSQPGVSRPRNAGRVQSAETRERIARAKSENERRVCAALSWPEVTIPAHARVLALLSASGPLSHAEIAARLGLKLYRGPTRPKGQNAELVKNLSRLRRGLRYVVLLPRSGGTPPRYAVAPWLLARREPG